MKKILLLATAALLLPAAANADPSGFCGDGEIIIVDGKQECLISDNFAKLVSDYENFQRSRNPYSASEEGDEKALRKLPDVSPEKNEALREKLASFQKRHSEIATTEMNTDEKLNHELFGFVIGQQARRAAYDEARIPFTNDSGFFNELSFVVRNTKFEKRFDGGNARGSLC